MLHTVNLCFYLVRLVRYMLLHSRPLHPAFQYLKCFRQLLDINTKLQLESMVIPLSTPLRFQLCNSSQDFHLTLLCLLPKCKDFLLKRHQTLLGLSIRTNSCNTVGDHAPNFAQHTTRQILCCMPLQTFTSSGWNTLVRSLVCIARLVNGQKPWRNHLLIHCLGLFCIWAHCVVNPWLI